MIIKNKKDMSMSNVVFLCTGIFVRGAFVLGRLCQGITSVGFGPGGYCSGDFIRRIMSVDFVHGLLSMGFMSGEIWSRGLCPASIHQH